ncbi:hypothetical protein X943_002529 [Babesia divergens]|uniref:Protein YIPF n=1 Tax=Babesia divergens TaxID=32595 RepID=A0AAD9LHT1_BABDI|nr:hypothetical protein X943_002529 [Babesia divergens]
MKLGFSAWYRKDAVKIATKLLYVLKKDCYIHRGEELVKWDLFGPFLISLLLPLIVYFPTPLRDANSQNLAFALFFAFLWLMPFVSALNACLVGTYMDYLPLMSIILYELFPICVSAIIVKILSFIPKVVMVAPAVIYSLSLSKKSLEGHMVKDKWVMIYTPIVFMYITVGVLAIFNA